MTWRPATWSLYATRRSRVARNTRPKASPGNWSAGSASKDVKPRQQTFLSYSLYKDCHKFAIIRPSNCHTQQLLLSKQSMEKEKVIKARRRASKEAGKTYLLKLARIPLFLTSCSMWNQRLNISDATPNFCNMLKVSAAL